MFEKAVLYYFSPTGGTKKVGQTFCEAAKETQLVDLAEKEFSDMKADPEALAVIAVPVFGGRIPSVAAENLRRISGEGAPAVTLAVYGNRAYEDALLELNDTAKSCGFCVAASGAFIAQHSMAPEVGKGRPDEKDRDEIRKFAQKVSEKISKDASSEIEVPGSRPYKDEMKVAATPISADGCNLCGACASACPTGAISISGDAVVTDISSCILCMACSAACPQKARILPPPMQERMEQMLGPLKSVRRENETFL